ncbi:MAG: glycosyltransferase family 4 protein [Ignavibacteriales bacterium]|nr:MAG: glycosyltransferase family 4 protein [Ignavibacteriales bacterium]
MKVLYSCLSKSWGGMEMNTLTSVKQLLNRSLNAELICSAESRIHVEAVSMGILTHPVHAPGYFHPVTVTRISNIIRKGNFDLIHSHASKDLWLLVPALKLRGIKIPLLLTKHVGSFIVKKDFFHKWLYNRLTYALAISRAIENNLLKTCPLTKEKILLHHNGIDTCRFDPNKINRDISRKEFGLNTEDLLIGMMARFSPGKGHEEFLYAASELNKLYKNLKFTIVGEASRGENEYAESIKRLAESYELNNLIFTGYRSDTENVLAAMDIFVMPSHAEAFGIALAEAMSMGIPSVCADAEGLLDIAVDGSTSLLFEVKTGDSLKEKLIRLIESPSLRKSFSAASRERAVDKFEIEKLTDRVLDIYTKAIKK